MRSKSFVVVFALVSALGAGALCAQDRDVSGLEEAAPLAPDKLSREAPTTGLAAAAATKVVIGRGGWGLSFTVGSEAGCVFEYLNKGYDSRVTYTGKQGSGINEFLYYKVKGWKIVLAIRNQPVGGSHDMYLFVNDSPDPVDYADGRAYNAL